MKKLLSLVLSLAMLLSLAGVAAAEEPFECTTNRSRGDTFACASHRAASRP